MNLPTPRNRAPNSRARCTALLTRLLPLALAWALPSLPGPSAAEGDAAPPAPPPLPPRRSAPTGSPASPAAARTNRVEPAKRNAPVSSTPAARTATPGLVPAAVPSPADSFVGPPLPPSATVPSPNPALTATGKPPTAVALGAPGVTNPPTATPPGLISPPLPPVPTNLTPRLRPGRDGTNLVGRTAPVPGLPTPPAVAPVGAGTPPPSMGSLTNVIVPTNTGIAALAGSAPLPPNYIVLQSTPIEQVLMIYAELTGRTVLRPNTLPNVAITLRNVNELTKEEAIQALDSVLTLNGITMVLVGEKFVSAVPSQQAISEAGAFSEAEHDDLPEAGQFVTKIIQLKHANPTEVQPLLQSFGKVQNGIIAIDSTQTLVIRDYAANIKRMMEIIERVDVEVENDYRLEVIPIKYGKVEEIYSTMSSLTGGGGGFAGGGVGGAGAAGVRGARTGGGRGMSSRGGVGSAGGLGSAGGRYGQPGGYQQGRQIGGQFQPQAAGVQPGQPGGAAGGTFQNRLQQIVNRAAGGGGVQLLGDAHIVPDERSNSLIVFASKEDMMTITNIVAKVDRALAQVLIEAIIMDVSLTDSEKLGVSMLASRQTGKLNSTAGSNSGQSFLSSVTNLSGGGLPGGFSYFGKWAGDLDLAVEALASNGRGQVLQTPRIQTSHATPATFFNGETVPYVTSTYYGGYGYGPSSSFQQLSVGLDLSVTPYITPDGLVVMDIDQNIEELSGYTEITGVGKMPNTTQRRASSTVSVQDKETIMLGGYIRTAKSKSKSGVPLLKDIPLLGNLFRKSSSDNKRSELIVLLRPTVIRTPHEAAVLAREEQLRLPGIREMQREMQIEEQARHDHADRVLGEESRPATDGAAGKPGEANGKRKATAK